MKKKVLLKVNKKLEIEISGEFEDSKNTNQQQFLIESISITRGTLYLYTEFMDSLAFKYKKGTADDIWIQLEQLCLEKINNDR